MGMAALDRCAVGLSGLALPRQPGTYALFLSLEQGAELTVGRLGRFWLRPGLYVYTGSAGGTGGLAARLMVHLRRPRSPHWHIDYLRARARPVAVWLAEGGQRRECDWATVLAQAPGLCRPIPGFGASDCRCLGHLVGLSELPDRRVFAQSVGGSVVEIGLDG